MSPKPQNLIAQRPSMRLSRRAMLKLSAGLAASALLPGWLTSPVGASALPQAGRKRIYLAPDDHTDLFWTADDNAYQGAFLQMLDYYLDLTDSTAGLASDYQSRWNCDGSFWLWTYERNRTPAQFQRLIGRIRDGHVSAPLNALVVCLGGAPAEAVLRGMYYPGQLERRYDLRFPVAVAMENQTLPYGLGSLWAGAGAQYSWKGICNCDTLITAGGPRGREVYWWAGPDGSRILMKWNSLLISNQSMGGYAEARDPVQIVEYVDSDPEFTARYPYQIIGAFGKGWDDFETTTDEFVTVAQAQSNATRRVIVSNQQDFFADFESNYGGSIPTYAASFGNEWDLYCAALAEVSASVKRSTEKLRGAEALATLVDLAEPALLMDRTTDRDQAWMALGLFWEHNFGVVGRWDQFGAARIAWQRQLAANVQTYVDQLQADGVAALGSLISNPSGNLRFFAFNPLSWTRTDVADLPYDDPAPVHVLDLSTGQQVPSQIVTLDGQRFLRILAPDVPPVGYKVFEILPGPGDSFPDAATVTGNSIENDRYLITVADRGAITSLIDKTMGSRELARDVGGRVINDLGPGAGTLTVENAGPVSVTLLATATGPLAHTTRITLIRDMDRIDIRNAIMQNFGDVRTWAFGFELDAPDLWHEEVGAILRARLLADGGHYADQNARYDWLTLNHFADLGGADGVGVTLSNADCYFMQFGASTPTTLDTATPQIGVLAGGCVGGNGSGGLLNQGGDNTFLQRFALRSRNAYVPYEAMRFALEHQNPLITGMAIGHSAYPEDTFSLVAISDPHILLWALKPADDTDAVIARLWNLAADPLDFSMTFTRYAALEAEQTTHIETPIQAARLTNGALSETIGARQIKTFSLVFRRRQAARPTDTPAPAVAADPPATETASFPVILPDTGYPPACLDRCGDNLPG